MWVDLGSTVESNSLLSKSCSILRKGNISVSKMFPMRGLRGCGVLSPSLSLSLLPGVVLEVELVLELVFRIDSYSDLMLSSSFVSLS